MIARVYRWTRPNSEVVKFKGFSKEQLAEINPALTQTDTFLKESKNLNAEFLLKNPRIHRFNSRTAAETRYRIGGKAKVYVNPEVFGKNKYEWNPPGVVSHEIGHLIGPTRGTGVRERQQFRQAFSYRQKKWYHEQAPDKWMARRQNPVKNDHTRQATNAAEDWAETWRALTGVPFTNRTSSDFFHVRLTPERVGYMEKRVLK